MNMAELEAPLIHHRAPDGRSWYELGCYSSLTLDCRLEAAAAKWLDAPMVFLSEQRPATTSVGALLRDSRTVADALTALGLRAGGRIAIQVPNWREAYLLYLGALRVGVTFVPILPAYADAEIRFILADSGARVLFSAARFGRRDYTAAAMTLKKNGLVDEIIFVDDALAPDGALNWAGFMDSAAGSAPTTARDPDDVCAIFYTSGSTSRPKGVRHTHNTLGFEFGSNFFNDTTPSLGLNSLPLAHMGGILVAFTPFITGGGDFIIDVWNPDLAAQLVSKHRIVRHTATPFHLTQLIDSAERLHLDISSIKTHSIGGTAVPPAIVRRAAAHGIICCRCYGSTEHPTISQIFPEDPPELRETTEGRLLDRASVRIVDDQGRDLPCGESGEILSSGPELFVGYTDASLNEEAFVDGRWFRTGDIGVLDARQYLAITGREKDIIIRGGENISAREVEEVVAAHASVADAAAVAAPDALYGERVCAFVTLREGAVLSLEDLAGHFASSGFAKLKTPERLIVIEALPRTSVGKVNKAELKKHVNADGSELRVLSDELATRHGR
jgi:acyl-CoA synthetase (AMP-forming)/AMP-acid ligase II